MAGRKSGCVATVGVLTALQDSDKDTAAKSIWSRGDKLPSIDREDCGPRDGRQYNAIRRLVPTIVVVGGILITLFISRAYLDEQGFPSSFRLQVGKWVETVVNWALPTFEFIHKPVADGLPVLLDKITSTVESLPALTLSIILVGLVVGLSGLRLGILTTLSLLWVVVVGVWDEMLETLSFMVIAVSTSVVIGIAVGIFASVNKSLNTLIGALLDCLQSFPYFAYLVVMIVIFGPGDAAALTVTILWSFAPIARMTTVGIRGVGADIVESAISTGATRTQVLLQVRLPLARNDIRSGLNQTIMYAISMATISALIGGTGLGQPVWSGLTRLEFGQALEPGIALVLLAVVLDRASQGRSRDRTTVRHGKLANALGILAVSRMSHRTRWLLVIAIATPVIAIISLTPFLNTVDFSTPPAAMKLSLRDPVRNLVDSLNVNFGSALDALNNTVLTFGIMPIVDFLTFISWPAVLMIIFVLAKLNLRTVRALLLTGCVAIIGSLGMWVPAIYTIAVVGVAVAVSVVIGVPIGVLMSRSDRVAALCRLPLDIMQTLPIFLFVLPTVVFLGAGPVAGTFATAIYAMPPIIRYTNAALRDTDSEVIEAAISTGATKRQVLTGVRVPLGLPTITVGVNQTVILALAMAVVSAFIGTPGLGAEVLAGVTQARLSLGVDAGIAMFLLTVFINQMFAGIVRRNRNPASKLAQPGA